MVGPNSHTSPAAKPVLDVLRKEALTLKTYRLILQELDLLTHGPNGQDLHFQDATGPAVAVPEEILAEPKNPRIGRLFVPAEARGGKPVAAERIEIVQYDPKGIDIFNADRNIDELGRIIGHMSFSKETEAGRFNGEVLVTDAAQIGLSLECQLQPGQSELEREIGFFSNRLGLGDLWSTYLDQVDSGDYGRLVTDGVVNITEPIGKEIRSALSVFGHQ